MQHAFTCTLAQGALTLLLVLLACTRAPAQVVQFHLDGSPEGTVSGAPATARLFPGAAFVDSVEGQGVEPGAVGPALSIPVSPETWGERGTLAFRFRTSRTIRAAKLLGPDAKPIQATLLTCPVGKIILTEGPAHPILRVIVAQPGSSKPLQGNIYWSHLKGGRWYHLAVAWDLPSGAVDTYLNGVLQEDTFLEDVGPLMLDPDAPLELGGSMGESDRRASLAIDEVQLFDDYMTEAHLAPTLADRRINALEGEGRTVYDEPLDLSPYRLRIAYEADFSAPLNWVHEDSLFDGDKRVRRPDGAEWVLEGPGKAWTEDGRLWMETHGGDDGHLVLWNTREFPSDFLLEYGFSPDDSNRGLHIVFLGAKSLSGGSIFDLDLPLRGGLFRNYHSGELNCYHISGFATSETGRPRRTTNVRKNQGFFLVTCGDDRITGQGPGPHLFRLLKVGGKIALETRGLIASRFDDDGETYGPVWQEGLIGLRIMGYTGKASFSHFRVWEVHPAE